MDISTFLASLALAAIGFLLGVFALPFGEVAMRFAFGPKLLVEFTGAPECLVETTEIHEHAVEHLSSGNHPPAKVCLSSYTRDIRYVRIRVTSRKRRTARECHAFLVGVTKLRDNGEVETTAYCDVIPLRWSYHLRSEKQTVDIPFQVSRHCDVFSADALSNELAPSLETRPNCYAKLFSEHCIYQLEVLVSADGVKPQAICLQVDWRGGRNNYDVETCRSI